MLNQKKNNNRNRPITKEEIEAEIKGLLTKVFLKPDVYSEQKLAKLIFLKFF